MKSTHIVAALCALFALAGLTARADVRWVQTVWNFGAFDEEDGKVSAIFRFINEGDRPVSISTVSSSCGCTVPEYSREPVAPGADGEVTAVFNPYGRPGRFSKYLRVKMSDGKLHELKVEGVVIGARNTVRSRFPVADGPLNLRSKMITFGSVKRGSLKSQYIEVYNSSDRPVAPSWSDVPPFLRVTAAHDTVPPGEQGVYSFVFAPRNDTPYGLITDSIRFDVPGQPPLSIEIAAIVEEDFSKLTEKQRRNAPVASLSETTLDFGSFSPDAGAITRTFKITNRGNDPLLLRRVYTADPGFTIDVSADKVKKGKSATVTVTFDPLRFKAPLLNGRLLVITNDPSEQMTAVRLVGTPQ